MAERILPWREVTALEPVNGGLTGHLATLDTLRSVWERTVQNATPEEFAEARRRSLRRHAIETGIIERLYEVDWGVTEALVAEGLTLEAAEAHGAIDPAMSRSSPRCPSSRPSPERPPTRRIRCRSSACRARTASR